MPGTRARRLLLAVAALVVVVAVVSVTSSLSELGRPAPVPPSQVPTHARGERPALIKYGQDIPSPEQVAAARETYDALPFDGIVMRIPESAQVFSGDRIGYDELLAQVSALPADLRMRQNWVRITLHDHLDWSDDDLWRTVAANAGAMARALRESGRPYAGIWFDNEWYGDGPSPWDYGISTRAWTPSGVGGATPGLSPEEATELVRSRGAQVMDAITAAWPDLDVMMLFGPWVSEPSTHRALQEAGLHYNDISWVNELAGPFFMGMVDRRRQARVVDGGEYYGARDEEDYAAFAAWQRSGFLTDSEFVTAEQAQDYPREVPAALAVYDLDQDADYAVHDPETLGDLTRSALEVAQSYVWLYTEAYEWGASRSMKPHVPQEYVDAIADARAGG
ncbi:hypothetical protein ATJ97_1603 [Georgenia soli]|uniref:Cellulase (Glycosyl hydrolase family 5) n=1 Tax=Georgenia soli TaxID=638953 RepID=A0A2A9EJM5_9MICO|nr:hypothetical protein [Georgenia soli]PFG39108.1 hypothetical protein ATJ97_1603 [Georgenia soli]